MLTGGLLGFGVVARWFIVLAVLFGGCESSKPTEPAAEGSPAKSSAEAEPAEPAKGVALKPTEGASAKLAQPAANMAALIDVGPRILAELRTLLPALVFESIDCPTDVKPANGAKMMCRVNHGAGNADRHIEVSFTDSTGGFMWGRRYLAKRFEARLLGFLRTSWPVPIRAATCSETMVSYLDSNQECRIALANGDAIPVLITWKSKLGKFHVDRLSDVAALGKHIRMTLESRGMAVKSVSCPRRVILAKSMFNCTVERADGTALRVPVTSNHGNATIGVPIQSKKTKH